MKTTPSNSFREFDGSPDWLMPDEARRLLRVGRSSIYKLIRSGAIPSRRWGRMIRIPTVALRPLVDLPDTERKVR